MIGTIQGRRECLSGVRDRPGKHRATNAERSPPPYVPRPIPQSTCPDNRTDGSVYATLRSIFPGRTIGGIWDTRTLPSYSARCVFPSWNPSLDWSVSRRTVPRVAQGACRMQAQDPQTGPMANHQVPRTNGSSGNRVGICTLAGTWGRGRGSRFRASRSDPSGVCLAEAFRNSFGRGCQ